MNNTRVLTKQNPQTAIDALGGQVGNTPLLHLTNISREGVEVYAKCEWAQLSGSVKARAAYGIVKEAIGSGLLYPGKQLLDASSGNTAIAYGHIGRALDIDVTICLPENASIRRIELLRELGVEIVFTSPFEGTEGAQAKARELWASDPDRYFYADQYSNAANWRAHYNGTALEILSQTAYGITHFVAGLGTTGTFVGTTRRLKEEVGVTAVALQPDSALHALEGWKHLETADIPAIYDSSVADAMRQVSSEAAIDMIARMDRDMGLRISPSSAANLVGAANLANELESGLIVTVMPDSIDRYKELERQIFTT